MPPTWRTSATLESACAPPQRSIASDSAWRTRTSSNGFFLVLKVTTSEHTHGVSCTVAFAPSVFTSRSRSAGECPRNSASTSPAASAFTIGAPAMKIAT